MFYFGVSVFDTLPIPSVVSPFSSRLDIFYFLQKIAFVYFHPDICFVLEANKNLSGSTTDKGLAKFIVGLAFYCSSG